VVVSVVVPVIAPLVVSMNALGRREHRGEVNEYGRRGDIP
jgi:hypothetical protein